MWASQHTRHPLVIETSLKRAITQITQSSRTSRPVRAFHISRPRQSAFFRRRTATSHKKTQAVTKKPFLRKTLVPELLAVGLISQVVTNPFSTERQFDNSKMSAKLIPQNPSDVMVIRNITPNVVTLSVPFARFGVIKVGGRATIGACATHNRHCYNCSFTNILHSKTHIRGSRRVLSGGSHARGQGQAHRAGRQPAVHHRPGH